MPRRNRPIFLPLHVDFEGDEKVARFARYTKPGEARALRDLLVACWRYCKKHKSDGRVPAEIIGTFVYPDPLKIAERDMQRLIDCGLAQRTDDGYYFPGFLKHNPSKAEIAALGALRAEIGAQGGKAKAAKTEAANLVRTGLPNEQQEAKQVGKQTDPQRSEVIGQTSELGKDLGEERPEPLRAVPATEPPSNGETCTRHPHGNPNDEDCRGCQKAEEHKQRRIQREADKRQREDERRALACDRCDGYNVVDPDTKLPTRRKCDHRQAVSA